MWIVIVFVAFAMFEIWYWYYTSVFAVCALARSVATPC